MKNKILIFILLLGLILRLAALGNRPLGFTWDEAALGYNAYSLLLTGRDEHSQAFPLIFKSFGDFKPGLYIYFSVLPVKLLGLSEFSTRLPSAIFGTLSILLIYLLTKRLKLDNLLKTDNCSLLTSLLFAINPVMIHFSRGAWEANLNLFLLLLITNLFIRQKYFLTVLFAGLSFYAYQGAKLNTPFLLLILYIALKPRIKQIIMTAILFLFLILPMLYGLKDQSGRLKVFSVFSYTRSSDYVQNLVSQDPAKLRSVFNSLYHFEKLDQFRGIFQRFVNHLSPRYMFIEGNWTDGRQSTVYYGNFHLFEALTIVIGFIYLAKKHLNYLLLLITLIGGFILPSALSRDIITTVRSLPLVIPLTILSAIGLTRLFSIHKLLPPLAILYILFSIVYFTDLYFRHNSYFTAMDWLFPYKPAITLVTKYQSNYSQIYFTDKLGQPYIFFLFYQKYPPTKYQLQNSYQADAQGDVGQVTGLDNIYFSHINWPALRTQKDILVIGDKFELPQKDLNLPNLVNYGDIKYPSGQIGLRVVGLVNNYAQK